MVVWDVRTRWNYTHVMIRRVLLLKEAVNAWVFQSPSLHGCILLPADWTLLEQLADVLEARPFHLNFKT
ncbi:hypothetical protein L208DRAFT_1234840 [Tricholoma matsutake]|nr:hypothetical protein L208DRAFT_1234840 [Tricholoma matsutake 945]